LKLAAIDIGSNSIKLAVVDAVDSNSFAVVTREKDAIRPGHRGPLPKKRHSEYAALSIADRDLVCKLAGIVKLADALDRSHDSRVYDLDCKVEPEKLLVEA